MTRYLLGAAALLSATALLNAQNAREQVLLPTNLTQVFDNVIATEGDLSAIAYSVNNTVEVRTSNGAGKVWGAGVRVDQDPAGTLNRKDITRTGLQIVNGIIYVLWNDRRGGGQDLYYSASGDGGATWTPEVLVFGFGGGNALRDWRMAIGGVGALGAGTVAVLAVNDPDNASNEELLCRVSFDGGTNFLPQSAVPQGYLPGIQDVDDVDIAIAPDLLTVNVVFSDDRAGGGAGFPDDVFFQQSIDGAQSWLATDRQLTTIAGANQGGLLDMEQSGNKIAVTWIQSNGGVDEVRLAVSNDGGATFGDVLVASATDIGDQEGPQLGIASSGNIIVAYNEGFSFNGIATTLTTTDDGATFTTPSTYGVPSTVDTASFPALSVQGNGASLTWSTAQSGGMADRAFTAVTNDGGLTWSPAIEISTPMGPDVDFVVGAYNGLNDNALVCFKRDPGDLFVSGVRPQTIDVIGWDDITNPASTTLQFVLDGFPGDQVVFVVLSTSTGPSGVGLGREICLGSDFVGLFADPLFTAPLVMGSGTTAALPNIFQPFPSVGITLNYAGIGFSSAGAGKITDSGSFVF